VPCITTVEAAEAAAAAIAAGAGSAPRALQDVIRADPRGTAFRPGVTAV
jgi:carbamoyl-phosphate synthase large subunit